MSESEVLYSQKGAVATITLNRPDQLNAITGGMLLKLRAAAARAGDDDSVRAIVLTGAGRGFCAGADMQGLNATASGSGGFSGGGERPQPAEIALNSAEEFDGPNTYFPLIPKPVIGAINGPCAGLGFVIALFTDIRIASDKAVFTTAFSRRGLIAEHGCSWMLPQLVGIANATDLLFSARRVSPQEAERMGLVNRVIEHESFADEVAEYARMLAEEVSPRSLRIMKEQLYASMFQTMQQSLKVANREMALSLRSDDFKEGVAHFLEKRAPQFTGK
ncbi:MAG: enoyl-CoA hydratase [Gammaproteobacteria bacterium AqS3]|nr:enoyl-CoA hydratase [Gammaproteobacteria bacterium AqS3]